MIWALHFLGVGNAAAVELGAAAAVIERDGAPLLLIDCGPDALTAYLARYGALPAALFITHTHLDHVGGMEQLFVGSYFDPARRGRVRLYVPAQLVPLLQARIADYPNVLAEGGANFWDAFQLIPVSRGFWHAGVHFEVFPVRHHAPETAYGLRLRGSVVYTGDTRPIPEMLARYADDNELVAHDCALHGNPSHSGADDLQREYSPELLARLRVYHYASAADAAALTARGFAVAEAGRSYALAEPTAAQVEPPA